MLSWQRPQAFEKSRAQNRPLEGKGVQHLHLKLKVVHDIGL